MIRNIGWIGAASFILLACPASAGEIVGKVKQLVARDSDGLHFVTIEGVKVGGAACASHPYFIIKDENSVTGKSQFAMLMSAFLTGTTVRVDGAGTCARWHDGEDILQVVYQS